MHLPLHIFIFPEVSELLEFDDEGSDRRGDKVFFQQAVVKYDSGRFYFVALWSTRSEAGCARPAAMDSARLAAPHPEKALCMNDASPGREDHCDG